jgi:DNA mismatch repair protein MutS
MTQVTLSPMMQQWQDLKNKQPDAILLFRLGDFYEAFYKDAITLSEVLDITLTKRQDIPMSGIPYHSFASYIDTLLEKGFKIAVAEQVENPKDVKGLVKRDIVKILSPGASFGSSYQAEKKHHFIALCVYKKGIFGLAWLDITLNDLYFQSFENAAELINSLSLIAPKELLLQKEAKNGLDLQKLPSSIIFHEVFDLSQSHVEELEKLLKSHFSVYNLQTSGLAQDIDILASGKLLDILKHHRLYDLKNIKNIIPTTHGQYLMIDKATMNHLELFDKKEGKYDHLTLFNHLNHTHTSAGSRLFESWLKFPLTQIEDIKKRQQAILFFKSYEKTALISNALKSVKDIQKILTKINQKLATAQDLKNLQRSLENAIFIKNYLQHLLPELLQKAEEKIFFEYELIELLDRAILDVPSARLNDGPTFKKNFSQDLDELLYLAESQDEFLKNYEQKLKDDTGIKNLKVGSSKNFGFYIEISKAQAVNAPKDFIRRQTLTNQERFITDELAKFEKQAASALDKLHTLERELFDQIQQKIIERTFSLISIAEALSLIDVLLALSHIASKPGYSLPEFVHENTLVIKDGRHPIIEELIGAQNFISNDLNIDKSPRSLLLITGPNMGGKSTYMRQAALCVIMAQLGSFVPATYMKLSPVDKLFTRIGASDDLAQGSSTFMIEMSETAYILKNATSQSLVILDEIGRGTSTYDGIAIAYAIAKFLTHHPSKTPKTLFATHYFELTELSLEDPQIHNIHVTVKEDQGQLLFLHKIKEGAADKSYGIQVAKLAGIPEPCIKLAKLKLKSLLEPGFELFRPQINFEEDTKPESSNPIKDELASLKIDQLTPLEALNILNLWKNKFLT